jgi:hypothetical protein
VKVVEKDNQLQLLFHGFHGNNGYARTALPRISLKRGDMQQPFLIVVLKKGCCISVKSVKSVGKAVVVALPAHLRKGAQPTDFHLEQVVLQRLFGERLSEERGKRLTGT